MSEKRDEKQTIYRIPNSHHRHGVIERAHKPRRTLIRLANYLRPHTLTIGAVLGLAVLSTGSSLAGPILMGRAVDGYILTGNTSGLAFMCGWLLLIFLFGNAVDILANRIMAGVSQKALRYIRSDLFSHLQTLDPRYFDNKKIGWLMSHMTNDIDAVNTAVSQNIVSLATSTLLLIGILITMFVLNVFLTLASVLVVPLMFWFTGFVARKTRLGFRDLQEKQGRLGGVLEESISGQRVIRIFRRSETATEAFRKYNREVYHSAVYANSYGFLLMPLTNQLSNLFVIMIAGLGGYLALKNLVSVGVIVTFISFARGFINPLRQLAHMYNSIQAALAGAERIFNILDTPARELDVNSKGLLPKLAGHIQFERVHFGYDEGKPILKNITFEVKPGETAALVGPTGAGKSTIINLLTRFYEPDSGQIIIDGSDIRLSRRGDLRRRLGIVPQDTFLFSTSVMENIRYGRLDADDEEVVEAAQIADADYFIRQLPQGYQTVLSERAGNLSQGQRQLLAIARAVLANPSILILDEATSSVDTRTERRIQKSLARLMQGRSSLLIAHRLSTVRDADNILVLHDGEIVEQGTHEQLLHQEGLYRELYLSQFKGEKI